MYYQGGLIFISARNEAGIIKRVFNYNQTPFLDMYFQGDTAKMFSTYQAPSSSGAIGGSDHNNRDDGRNTAAQSVDQSLTKAEIFSRTLNSKYQEGPMTFFKDQKRIIFTRNNDDRGKSGKSDEGIRKLKLY